MVRTTVAFSATAAVMLIVVTLSYAEVRVRHYTPEELYEQSTLVFKGTVLAIENVPEFNISFPVRARVDAVVKGRWREKEIAFRYKHPGLHAIFRQEYNHPETDKQGTFYVQNRNGTLLLIGFISDTDPAAALSPLPILMSPSVSDEKE